MLVGEFNVDDVDSGELWGVADLADSVFHVFALDIDLGRSFDGKTESSVTCELWFVDSLVKTRFVFHKKTVFVFIFLCEMLTCCAFKQPDFSSNFFDLTSLSLARRLDTDIQKGFES